MTEAAISAILEAAETCFAEQAERFDTIVASADQLNIPANRFERHLQDGVERGWRGREIAWVAADNLLSGGRDMVPFELVHTAYVLPPLPYDGIFAASTSGLAAAFAEPDAIVHGLLESIERDAISRGHSVPMVSCITNASIPTRSRTRRSVTCWTPWRRRMCWSAFGRPCRRSGFRWHGVICWRTSRRRRHFWTIRPTVRLPASSRPAPSAHAIYEAVQARLAAISGAARRHNALFLPEIS